MQFYGMVGHNPGNNRLQVKRLKSFRQSRQKRSL